MKRITLFITLIIFAVGCSKEIDKLEGKGENIVKEMHNLTTTDLYSMKRLSEMQLSPDGKWIVYVVATPSIEDNKITRDLWATSIDGKFTHQVTDAESNEMSPIFSPCGKKIAYLSTEKGALQIYIQDFPQGSPKKLTDVENGVSNILWSPDGKYISYTSDVKLQKNILEDYPEYDKANLKHYTELPVRHWDEWTDESFSHLFVMPIDGGKAIDLLPNELVDVPLKPFGGVSEITWSPDSKQIIYTAKKDSDFVINTNSDLYLVDLIDIKNGKYHTKNLTTGMMGYDKNPLYSPDGKYIAFSSQERPGFESDKFRIMLYNTETNLIDELTSNLDQWSEEFTWGPKSDKIYTISTDSGVTSLFEFDITTKLYKKLSKGDWDYGHGLAVSSDGKHIVTGKNNFNNPLDYYVINLDDGKETKLTRFNDERLKYINPCKWEQRWFTATDGKKIHSWIIYPPDFDKTKKYPVITYLQGGPQSMISQNYHYRWNFGIYASNGYIILAANRRGLPGFGQAWNDAISLDWGGMPMSDLLAATDQFSTEPFVDLEGRSALGASAGGYAAYWLAGHHEGRFNAFVAHNGVFDVVSKYGATEETFFPNWEFGGPYWEQANRDNMERNSPHNFVKNWNKPILISIGERDFRVPYTQGLEAFSAARLQDIPAELIYFPNETHFISRSQEYIVWQDLVIKFLDKYTKKK